MTQRTTFSLEEDNFIFLNSLGVSNKSAYINDLLSNERQKTLEKALLRANQEEAEDVDYQAELAEWDGTLIDGLSD